MWPSKPIRWLVYLIQIQIKDRSKLVQTKNKDLEQQLTPYRDRIDNNCFTPASTLDAKINVQYLRYTIPKPTITYLPGLLQVMNECEKFPSNPFSALESISTKIPPWWLIIGLSKIERPILDHHAKAHNFEIREIRRISPLKSGRFHHWKSPTCGNVFNMTLWQCFLTSLLTMILTSMPFNITCGNVFNITCGNALYFISGSWIIPWPIFWWWKRQRYYIRFVCVNVKKVQ